MVKKRIITERGLATAVFCGAMPAYHTSARDGSRVLGMLTCRSNSGCEEAATSKRVLETGDLITPEGYGKSFHTYRVELRDEKTEEDPYVMVHTVDLGPEDTKP